MLNLYTVLYRVGEKLYGTEFAAVNPAHAVGQFQKVSDCDVVFVDLGNRKTVRRLYKLEQSKICDVYVWKVSATLSGNTQWQAVLYVGADCQSDAVQTAQMHLTSGSNLPSHKYRYNTSQAPFYSQRYGVLDVHEFEV